MSIRLTQTVKKGGCAAKVAAAELQSILQRVKFRNPPSEVLVNGRHFDDAAIFRVSEEVALVQTLDFFTPIVDDPFTFGKIAAANAMSDVYAMGGIPKTALAILAFPVLDMDQGVIAEVLQGAIDRIELAGADLVGGHSIDDETLKFGLSITGLVHPKRMWTNSNAKVGDRIILTKPLGTGTLTAGVKRGNLQVQQMEDALSSMTALNRIPEILSDASLNAVHAATDVTGFGFSGHSYQVARASRVSLRIATSLLPVFERTFESLQAENLTKAHRTNREYTAQAILPPMDSLWELLIHDPQTSGGLLLFVDEAFSIQILEEIRTDFPKAAEVGVVEDLGDKFVIF